MKIIKYSITEKEIDEGMRYGLELRGKIKVKKLNG